jgi:radical SAM protein with 4Fe4S-binding SPASM domain
VIVGSEFEPTIHPDFDKLLRLAIARGWKLDFLTNGINLDRYDPALLADVPFHVFNISFDGATQESFERIRRGANYHRALQNILKTAEITRRSGAYTGINATILKSNLHELPDMVRFWNAQGFDVIRLLIMQVRQTKDTLFDESLYPVIDELKAALDDVAAIVAREQLRIGVFCGYFGTPDFVAPPSAVIANSTLSSAHPLHRSVPRVRQDFQAGSWPGMNWPCRSPYVYARIRWDGAVDICNRRDFVIGNIYEMPFDRIWRGAKAEGQRKHIKGNRSICETCDYFRLCINFHHLRVEMPDTHFGNGILADPKTVEWLAQIDASKPKSDHV